MDERDQGSAAAAEATVSASDRELVLTRVFDAPPAVVFDAWTRAELFTRWWVPPSSPVPLRSCRLDVRVGGGYRLEFGREADETMAFFGRYLAVDVPSRLVWTNEESEAGPVTTVTFTERDGKTLLELRERYPSSEALDQSADAMAGGMAEQFGQLDVLLASLNAPEAS